jgi:nitrite reductase (NADH) small subunit
VCKKTKQIAILTSKEEAEWYACQNACPHKMEMVLSEDTVLQMELQK